MLSRPPLFFVNRTGEFNRKICYDLPPFYFFIDKNYMALEYGRNQRVAELIQRELADLIRDLEIQGLGLITISAVDVSPDLRQAKIYVTQIAGTLSEDDAVAALTEAARYLRRELAHRVKLRGVPRLYFKYDTSISEGARMSALINKVNNPEQDG